MKHPTILLLAIILSIVLWGFSNASSGNEIHHKPGHQLPPPEIWAVGRPIDCGAVDDRILILRRIWNVDKKIMEKGLMHPVFIKDWMNLRYYEEIFWLILCSRA